MEHTVISERGPILIRRQVLNPGAASPWHTDRCDRFTVVVRGEQITIEFRDSGERVVVPVHPGLAEWDAPEPRPHRAINTGTVPYEEVVTFYRNAPGTDPQPEAE